MNHRLAILITAGVALLVLAEALFAPHHAPVFAWQQVPGHLAALGALASMALVFLAKGLGKACLLRPESEEER
jgi:hypothetical protein